MRTLALAYRKLDEDEYYVWNAEFVKAKTTIGFDRENMLERAADLMERELILIGATAVEDKLQKGVFFLFVILTSFFFIFRLHLFHLLIIVLFIFKKVPQCIDKLAQAGLKIWVLTGDKMETAINIGYVNNP